MTEPITCEARLMGLSKTRRKDGDWVEIKFHIHPDDHPAALFILPLGTDCNLAISGVDESEGDAPDEPVTATAKWTEAKRKMVQRSGIVRNEEAFHQHVAKNWPSVWNHPAYDGLLDKEKAVKVLHYWCGVDTCRDLDPVGESGKAFRNIMRKYDASQHGETTEAFERQRNEGPR